MDLLGDDSGSEVDFTINENYAKRYEKWRRGEEIQKLKDKYGDVDNSDSSTSEEEDEDGQELTVDVEKQFYKTLSCLKEKNPKIYDQNVRFFEKPNPDKEVKVKKKSEPSLSLAGYQRKVLLETGGQFSDKEDNEEQPFELMSNQDQEKDIKQSFKDALKDSDDEDEEQWGNLFTRRVKTAEELEKEDEDFRQWLAGEKEKLKNSEVIEELKGLHDYWADPKLDEGEKFLRDYILNKRYLDHEDKHHIPSYDEIIHDSDSNLSADEDMINKQDEFEKKYNFRFEEPDREFIKRYPRTLEQSMRKKDERRKKHREEVKQRKQAERSKKDEELKCLKALKKKEIMDKIKKLQQITGNEDITFSTEDLEGDFDPEEYDKRMTQIFNEDYYGTGGDEDEKPEFHDYDEDLDIENWDAWEGHNQQDDEELHCEDPGFNMDCEYDPTKKKELQQELIENSRRRKKRKKSKFAEALEREKPIFDPKDKTFEQYVDEYYALDYEDIIDDVPCRFKYRKVVPNDFGLSIEEILNASDQELNRWVSIKKITRRLPEHVELYDVKAYKRKAANPYKKAKCFPSLYGPKSEEIEQLEPVVKSSEGFAKEKEKNFEVLDETKGSADVSSSQTESGLKKKTKKKADDALSPRQKNIIQDGKRITILENGNEEVEGCRESKKKKKKKKKNIEEKQISESLGMAENVSVENGVGRKSEKKEKKKRKLEEWIEESVTDVQDNVQNIVSHNEEIGKKKKRRKKRKREESSGGNENKLKNSNSSQCEKLNKKAKKRKHAFSEEKDNQGKKNEGKNNKKRKFNNHNDREKDEICAISDERLRSYGLNPKKYKNKLKYKNKNQ